MIDTTFLNQIGRFDLVLKKRVLNQYSGQRQSSNVGDGLVFSDYRGYLPGDDFRLIDWNLYARTDEYFIKRFEEEKNMTLQILLDASSSMDFGNKMTKYEYGAMVGLGFAYLAARNNEKFEFSIFAERFEILKSKKGHHAFIELVQMLNKKEVKGKSHFYDSISSFKKRLKSRSMIIIISDFLFNPAELERSLALIKKSEIVVVQVLDPEEVKLSIAGDFFLKDSEEGHVIKTFISNRLRTSYKDKLGGHIAELQKICGSVNAKFYSVTSDTPIFDTFAKIMKR